MVAPERLLRSLGYFTLKSLSFNSDLSSWPLYSVCMVALWRWSLMKVPLYH